jgi:hypothetical protein
VEEETNNTQKVVPKRRISSVLVSDEYASQLDVDMAVAKELQQVYEEEDSFEGELDWFQERMKVSVKIIVLSHFRNLLYRF